MLTTPQVSVILPTRDRPDQLDSALQAILASTFADFELIVVDQSSSGATAEMVSGMAIEQQQVRLVRDGGGAGSSHARNVGVAASRGELIVFTDDDCIAGPNWLAEIVDAFDEYPSAGLVCGAVVPGPHDTSAGFIVGYQPTRCEQLRGRLAKLRDAGIGANMAVRRSVLLALGGWDEMLGAGGAFDGAGDLDLIYRALAANYGVLHLPQASVIHHGFRNWEIGGRVIRGRFRGIGAAYTKHARLGDPVAILLFGQQLWLSLQNLVQSLLHGRRPLGLGRILALLTGSRDSFKYPLDPGRRCYRASETPQPSLNRRQTDALRRAAYGVVRHEHD